MMARKVSTEITKINKFENEWKIKTNRDKFKIIPMAQKKMEDVIVEGDILEYAKEGNILGQTINTTGFIKHIATRIRKAKETLKNIYIFYQFPVKIKLHLVKTLILPILYYPPIPTHTLSMTQIKKIQKVQNKALRYAYNERYPYTRTVKEMHIEA